MGKNDLVQELITIIKCNSKQAQSLLEKNQWSLQEALTDYYDNGLTEEEIHAGNATSTQTSSSSSRVTTLSEFLKGGDKAGGKKKEFYTGGEKSGMAVQDPDSDDDDDEGGPSSARGNPMFADANPLARSLIEKASRAGSSGNPPPPAAATASSSSSKRMPGKGFRLNAEAQESESEDEQQQQHEEHEEITITITLWKNGFSVNDEDSVRDYNTPENKAFMEQLNSGRVPASLGVKFNQRVSISLNPKTQENFVAPPKKFKAFSGAGQRLGSVTPAVAFSSPAVAAAAAGPTSSAPKPPTVDPSKPTTSIQIRFVDGTKIVAKLNQDHLVKDLITFIHSSKPSEIGKPFILQTTLPKRQLSDLGQTLKEAGLLNVAVIQVYL